MVFKISEFGIRISVSNFEMFEPHAPFALCLAPCACYLPGGILVEKHAKKEYEKPRLTRISLDAKCAVLGFCKTDGSTGPGTPNCFPPGLCKGRGS